MQAGRQPAIWGRAWLESPALPLCFQVGYVLSLDPVSDMSRYPRAGFVGVPGLTLTTRRTGCGAVPEGRCPQRSGIVGGYPTARSASTSDLSACCLLRIVASLCAPTQKSGQREEEALSLCPLCGHQKSNRQRGRFASLSGCSVSVVRFRCSATGNLWLVGCMLSRKWVPVKGRFWFSSSWVIWLGCGGLETIPDEQFGVPWGRPSRTGDNQE